MPESDPLENDIRAAAHLPPVDDTFDFTSPGGTVALNRLGKYALHEQIGSGGMARVYRATQDTSSMPVAVKTCRVDTDADILRLRFRREIAIAARLVHDNIVRFHDADEDNGRPFLAMELLHGAPLHALMMRGPMRLADACEIVRQIAAGLEFAHKRGVVHRDIKPGNAFLTLEGVVKILDWGLAKAEGQEELTYTFQCGGTPGYMPPEQERDLRSVDSRADLYALGVTLWALLLGRKPTAGEALPADLPPNLGALLARMTAPAPADRPTAREVVEALVLFATTHDLPALVGRPTALVGDLFVEWWDAAGQRRRTLHEAGALPMPTQTHLYLEARLHRPAYVYLLWIDTEGKLYPLYGWQKDGWHPDAALTLAERVQVPGSGQHIPLEGAAGTETVVLLARERPLTEAELPLFGAERLQAFRENLSQMPRDPRQCYVFPALGVRGPGSAQPTREPIESLHEALRDLCGRFDLVKAVSFANRGR
ncbi:MAG TPA: protein kinase [Gemmata sp.]